MTPPSPSAPAAPVSPPLGLRLEDGGGITPFWRVMIALTGLGMVALAALLLLTCSWAKPKHLILGKVTPTRTAATATAAVTPSPAPPRCPSWPKEARPRRRSSLLSRCRKEAEASPASFETTTVQRV